MPAGPRRSGGDEREIEAVAREIHAARNGVWRVKRPWSDLTASECRAYRAMANAALDAVDALDRVRGVRDDNKGLADFQENLTRALNEHGVPAMSSWQAAIDWLAEHGGRSPQGEEDHEAAEVLMRELHRFGWMWGTHERDEARRQIALALNRVYLSRCPSPERGQPREPDGYCPACGGEVDHHPTCEVGRLEAELVSLRETNEAIVQANGRLRAERDEARQRSPERDTEKLVEQAERALYKLRTGKPQAAEEILAEALAEFTAPKADER